MEKIEEYLKMLSLHRVQEIYEQEAKNAAKAKLDYIDYPHRLLEQQVLTKKERSINRKTQVAGFPQIKRLEEFDRINGMLQGHPDMLKTPGVDMSSGALGQGLSVGIGMALGREALGKEFYVYVVLGDGELQ